MANFEKATSSRWAKCQPTSSKGGQSASQHLQGLGCPASILKARAKCPASIFKARAKCQPTSSKVGQSASKHLQRGQSARLQASSKGAKCKAAKPSMGKVPNLQQSAIFQGCKASSNPWAKCPTFSKAAKPLPIHGQSAQHSAKCHLPRLECHLQEGKVPNILPIQASSKGIFQISINASNPLPPQQPGTVVCSPPLQPLGPGK